LNGSEERKGREGEREKEGGMEEGEEEELREEEIRRAGRRRERMGYQMRFG